MLIDEFFIWNRRCFLQSNRCYNIKIASTQLANLYANGKGTSKNLGKTTNIFKPIVEYGNTIAQCNLVIVYRKQKEKEFYSEKTSMSIIKKVE